MIICPHRRGPRVMVVVRQGESGRWWWTAYDRQGRALAQSSTPGYETEEAARKWAQWLFPRLDWARNAGD